MDNTGISPRTLTALKRAGYDSLNSLNGVPVADLQRIYGFGNKGVSEVKKALEAEGMGLVEEGSSDAFDSIGGREHVKTAIAEMGVAAFALGADTQAMDRSGVAAGRVATSIRHFVDAYIKLEARLKANGLA